MRTNVIVLNPQMPPASLSIPLATIAGDIGGTNSRLALYSLSDALLHPTQAAECGDVVFRVTYRNAEYDSFEVLRSRCVVVVD